MKHLYFYNTDKNEQCIYIFKTIAILGTYTYFFFDESKKKKVVIRTNSDLTNKILDNKVHTFN
jgi:hypothetical protein